MDRGLGTVLIAAVLLAAACQSWPVSEAAPPLPPASRTVNGPSTTVAKLIYAAQNDGTLHVYDLTRSHQQIKRISVFACCADVRGIAAAAPTHRLFVMYNRASEGHVAALDLATDHVVWDEVLHSPGIDRGDVTPDGMRLYLPTWEIDAKTPYELVVDGFTGAEIARVTLPARSHDTIVSLDGKRVYMETKSVTHAMYVADTSSNQIVLTVSGYCCSGELAPFSVDGKGRRVVNDVVGYDGFQLADLTTGQVTASVPLASGTEGHGIAWTPNEREVWVNDGKANVVHVFDMAAIPPKETRQVAVSNKSPHWLTFSIDGHYAYVAGPKNMEQKTDVVDAKTYELVGALSPSEDLLEVDFANGVVSAVGNQFGIGRVVA
jgi:DNA-binding beta-propeller fold protein YncE